MAAELFDRDQYLHGGRPQLSHQLGGLQQGAQRHQHRADACQRHGDLHPLHAIRHDQTDPGPLADAGSDECGRHGAGGVVELGVADPGLGVDDHRLVTVLLCANPDQLVDRCHASNIFCSAVRSTLPLESTGISERRTAANRLGIL